MHLIGRLLIVIVALNLAACAARGGVPRPFPGAALPPGATEIPPAAQPAEPPHRAAAERGPAERLAEVVAVAMGYRGVPYRNGGSDPAGFDCSGFVQYVFKQVGSILPREVREQVHAGHGVDREDVKAGDLVFFQTVSRGASHVGLAIGGGEFVHAPSTNGVVRVERLSTSYWAQRYLSARRIN